MGYAIYPNEERQKSGDNSLPLVSLTKRGYLYFSRAAFEMIGSPQTVALGVDKEAQKVGIFPANTDFDAARRLTPQGAGYLVFFGTIAQACDIDVTQTRHFLLEREGIQVMFRLDQPLGEGD